MLIKSLFTDNTNEILKKGIEGTAWRHRAIANNIANVDTPGYKRRAVHFEESLKQAISGTSIGLKKTHPAHLSAGIEDIHAVKPQIERDEKTAIRVDGSNVDIDMEMAALAKNTGRFNAFVELLSRRYTQIMRLLREDRG